jgi:hypothetical protein
LAERTELRVVVASGSSAGGLKNALSPLLVGFGAKWPLAGFWLRRGSKLALALDSLQECPPWHHHWLSHEEGFVFIIGIDPH